MTKLELLATVLSTKLDSTYSVIYDDSVESITVRKLDSQVPVGFMMMAYDIVTFRRNKFTTSELTDLCSELLRRKIVFYDGY